MGDQVKSIKDLHGKNIVVFDLEICNPIDGKNIKWTDYEAMGISVGSLFDYRSGDYSVFLRDSIPQLAQRLLTADLIVGFNILQFDNALISAFDPLRSLNVEGVPGKGILDKRSYDLLFEMRRSLVGHQKGCKLDQALASTFGSHMVKTEAGSEAPLMYQRGELSRLITYNLADVRRERMLFEFAFTRGFVKTEMHGEHPMTCPLERLHA